MKTANEVSNKGTRAYDVQRYLANRHGIQIAQVMSLLLESFPKCEMEPFDMETVTKIWFKPKHKENRKVLKDFDADGYYWTTLNQCIDNYLLEKKTDDNNTDWYAINFVSIEQAVDAMLAEEATPQTTEE